jgi:hypothetical protein
MISGHDAAALSFEVESLVAQPEDPDASLAEQSEHGRTVWRFGSKALAVQRFVLKILDEDPSHCVLVFTTHPAYIEYLVGALTEGGLQVVRLDKGATVALEKGMRSFAGSTGLKLKEGEEARRVIILSMDKDCAGGDMPHTTHIVFVDPIMGYIHGEKDEKGNNMVEDLEATRGRMTQSLGRAVRLGGRDKHIRV